MTPLKDSFSIALAGFWNPTIFSRPDWMSQHLLKDKESKIAYSFQIKGQGTTIKAAFDEIELIVDSTTLRCISTNPSPESLLTCGNLASEILNLLGHTPILAWGVNLGFTVDEEDYSESLKELSDIKGTDILETACGGIVEESTVHRSIRLPKSILNFEITFKSDKTANLKFNFHHQTSDTSEICSLIKAESNLLREYYFMTQKICSDAYELK